MPQTEVKPCKICGQDATYSSISGRAGSQIICPRCGRFSISDIFEHFGIPPELRQMRYVIQAILRERWERRTPTFLILDKNADRDGEVVTLEDLLSSSTLPTSPEEKAMRLLKYIKKETGEDFGKPILIRETDYPLAYAKDPNMLLSLIGVLQEKGYIKITGYLNLRTVTITSDGWTKIEELEKTRPESVIGFVAMWFGGYKKEKADHPKYEPVTKADRNACYDAIQTSFHDTPYRPLRADDIESNNDINAEIIQAIKGSKFLIADVTGNRGGVYYEAGYAKAAGMEVIWLCKQGFETDRHFDTEHYNHIMYSTYEELTEKLHRRILATIL